MDVELGRLVEVPEAGSGTWYVCCKWWETGCGGQLSFTLDTAHGGELDAKAFLKKESWRLSMETKAVRFRWWSCPVCAPGYAWKKPTVSITPKPPPVQPVPPAGHQQADGSARASTPARAIEDVSGRVEQSPLAAVVDELKAEVGMLKAEVYELKEEIKLVKTGVARDEELETLQNEIRALKEQLSAQTCPRLTPAQIVHVSG